MDKAPDAFRTISEVSEVLDTPAHVLRFWESKFPQIRPVKRAGGRRYYRPGDVALLAGIRHLLHDQGLTIRGVQKVLRESGVRHVQALADGRVEGFGDLPEAATVEAALTASFLQDVEPESLQPAPEGSAEGADVVRLHKRDARAVERMHEETSPPANIPFFAAEVPEAPFIEAEEEDFGPAPVLHLTGAARRDAPTPAGEDLPLLARMAAWEDADAALAAEGAAAEAAAEAEAEAALFVSETDPAFEAELDSETAEDLADLAALDGVGPAEAGLAAADESEEAPEPVTGAPSLAELARRLRALPRPVSPETAAALAPLLAEARALQARLSAGRG